MRVVNNECMVCVLQPQHIQNGNKDTAATKERSDPQRRTAPLYKQKTKLIRAVQTADLSEIGLCFRRPQARTRLCDFLPSRKFIFAFNLTRVNTLCNYLKAEKGVSPFYEFVR